MIRLLTILAVSLFASNAGQARSNIDEIHLRATVQDVVLLTDFSGKVILVHFDPRFALTVRIESVDPAATNFTVGAVVTFATLFPPFFYFFYFFSPINVSRSSSTGCLAETPLP